MKPTKAPKAHPRPKCGGVCKGSRYQKRYGEPDRLAYISTTCAYQMLMPTLDSIR